MAETKQATQNVHPEFLKPIYAELDNWAASEQRSIKAQVEWIVLRALEARRQSFPVSSQEVVPPKKK